MYIRFFTCPAQYRDRISKDQQVLVFLLVRSIKCEGPQEYYDDSSDSDYSDYENMPADHINDYPVDHQEGVEGSIYDLEQGGVEDVIDTKAEEIYPIQVKKFFSKFSKVAFSFILKM